MHFSLLLEVLQIKMATLSMRDSLPDVDMTFLERLLASTNVEYKIPKTVQIPSKIPSAFNISWKREVDGSKSIGISVVESSSIYKKELNPTYTSL